MSGHGWFIYYTVCSMVWGFTGYMWARARARRQRFLERMDPRERAVWDAAVDLDRKIRRAAFRHPFWGRAKREAFFERESKIAMLEGVGYEIGKPCPARCVNRYVEAYDEEKGFVQEVPCPLCLMAEEVYGEVTGG